MSKKVFRRAITTGSAAAALAAALVAVPGSAQALVCSDWTPVLSSSTVNQGLGTYTPLVRGKTTLVRLFLTQPSCAQAAGQEQLIGGTLTATNAAGQQIDAPVSTVPVSSGPVYPSLESYGSTTPDSAGYPEFKLPAFGSQDSTPGTFLATFRASVQYYYPGTAGLAQGQATYTVTARVAPKPNALRILVVPMGDASDNFANEFPEKTNGGTAINGEYADTVVQNAMQTLSRTLPVYDGVGDLNSTAGLRYTLDDSGIVDLGMNKLKMMNENAGKGAIKPFCSTSTYWSNNVSTESQLGQNTVAGQLATFRDVWNTNNPSTPVDKVLGVIWQKVSQGSQYGCDDGRAMVGGNEAFIRLFADNTLGLTSKPNPSMSGALATMELAHTWGAAQIVSGSTRVDSGHHSTYTSADPDNTQRAYDVKLAKWLATPESGMSYTGNPTGYDSPSNGTPSPWNDTNVLLEQQDYIYSQCALTPGLSSTDCPGVSSPGAIGSAGASARAIVLSGTTDGTVGGTAIHSYYDNDPSPSAPGTPSSLYWLQTYDATGTATNTPLPDGLDSTVHGALPGTPGDVINAAVALNGVVGMSIWKGQPPAGSTCRASDVGVITNCLYARAAQDAPPTIVSTGGSTVLSNLADFTASSGDEATPSLSRDGKFLAWTASDGLHVQKRDASTNLPAPGALRSVQVQTGQAAAWSPDGTQLAFATAAGDIDTVTVGTASNPPTFGTPQTVYNHLLQSSPLGDTVAHHATWSPDGSQLAADIDGNIFSFSSAPTQNSNAVICDLADLVDTFTCKALTKNGGNGSAAWGGSGSGMVAFQHGSDLYTVDPAAAGRPQTLRVPNAQSPAWGRNLVGFSRDGAIAVANAATADPTGAWSMISTVATGGNDRTPALDGSDSGIAFVRAASTGDDVFDGTLAQDQTGPLQFTAATTGNPALLEADLYIACESANRPILVTLRPSSTTSNAYTVNGVSYNTAAFAADYDETMACPGGEIFARVTDGFTLSKTASVRKVPANQPGTRKLPLPAIAAPRPGGSYLQFDPVVAIGSSIDGTTTNRSDTTICWSLTGPSGSGYTSKAVGCGAELEIDPPQQAAPNGTKGWVPGTWSLTATVSDGSSTASTTVPYVVIPDPNHIGSNVTVSFNPQTLYVPSSGNDVTVTVKPQGQDLRAIDSKTVQIVRVGNITTSIAVDTASGTTGWSRNSDGTYTAKFNRQTLTCVIAGSGLTGLYVPLVIAGSGSGLSITGFDRQNPITTPSTSTVSC